MNCIKHPESPSAGTCAGCAEPFCTRCLVAIKGANYCGECKAMAVGKDAIASAGSLGSCPEAGGALKYAIIGIFCFGIILGPIAISKALKAKKMIAENPRLEGSGKATAALIIGILDIILFVVGVAAKVASAGGS